MLERNKESQANVLNDLQNEVKSLKSLLMARRPITPSDAGNNGTTTNGSSVSNMTSPNAPSPTTNLSARLSSVLNNSSSGSQGGIPAWQMAAANKEKAPATSSSSSPAQPAETSSNSSTPTA